MKLLIVTTDPLPYPGQISTGAGLRAWQLGQGLKSQGFDDVIIAMPETLREQALDKSKIPAQHCFRRDTINDFIHTINPDVLILQHWGLLKDINYVDCPLAIDLAGPHLLERFYWGEQNLADTIDEKVTALRKADFVVCGSHRQRYYFLPFLVQAGFEPSPDLLPVIPFSVSPDISEPPFDRTFDAFVYGGMLLPWQNPEKPLRWLLDVLELRGRGKLHFYGGPHPLGDVSGGVFLSLLEFLESHPQVAFHKLVPFDILRKEYSRYGVAVDVMARNFERDLASTTRTIIYLWAGLPLIHHNFTDIAGLIDSYKAGWIVDPLAENDFKDCIEHILTHPEDVRVRSRNARRLVRDHFTWDKTIEPLAEFCTNPYFRKDKERFLITIETPHIQNRRLRQQLEACKRELSTLKGKFIFKLYSRFDSFSFVLAPFLFVIGVLASTLLSLIFLANEILSPFSRKGKQ